LKLKNGQRLELDRRIIDGQRSEPSLEDWWKLFSDPDIIQSAPKIYVSTVPIFLVVRVLDFGLSLVVRLL